MDAVQVTDHVVTGIGAIAIEVVESQAIAAQPWLGLPVIRQAFELLLNYFGGKLFEVLEKSANIQVIDFQNEEKNSTAKLAASTLSNVAKNPKSTPLEKKKALNDFKNAYRDLIRQRLSTPN